MTKIPLLGGFEYEIPSDFYTELHRTYFNVDTELQKMRIWCLANPQRCKTPRGVHRFINNWLSRAHLERPYSNPAPKYEREIPRNQTAEGIKKGISACMDILKNKKEAA